MPDKSRQQLYRERLGALKDERSSWLPHWRELSEQILPRRSRFLLTDANKGTRRNSSIIDGTPTRAVRVLAAGMMGGITSPARPWFRLTTPDPQLAEFAPVRGWLHHVEERLRQAFAKGNIYRALARMYGSLGTFGTHAELVEEDDEDVLRAYEIPIGSYCLAQGPRRSVDTLYRELRMKVGQLVKKFGRLQKGKLNLSNFSQVVRDAWVQKKLDQWVDVVHLVEPNDARDASRADYLGMGWRSCWFEAVAQPGQELFLHEGGFQENPLLTPRWETTGEDEYGTSPGMDALGDCKALQLLQKRKAQVLELVVKPPMVGPSSLRTQRASIVPGDTTYLDQVGGGQKFEPAMEVDPRAMSYAREDVAELRQQINAFFFVDLFLMLATTDRRQITAREVAERHEEKLLQLGPVLEGLGDEVLDPLIDRAFGVLLRRGEIPPPPEELQGEALKVEYISVLHQAQKLVGIVGIERFLGLAATLAQGKPDVLDKVNADEVLDTAADILGIPPDLVNSDEEVAQMRTARAQQQQAAQQGAAIAAAAKGAKDLAGASLEGDNALNRMLGALSPVAGAIQPGAAA